MEFYSLLLTPPLWITHLCAQPIYMHGPNAKVSAICTQLVTQIADCWAGRGGEGRGHWEGEGGVPVVGFCARISRLSIYLRRLRRLHNYFKFIVR